MESARRRLSVLSRARVPDRLATALTSPQSMPRQRKENYEAAHALAAIAVDELQHAQRANGRSIAAEADRAETLAKSRRMAEARARDRSPMRRRNERQIPDAELCNDASSAAVDIAEACRPANADPATRSPAARCGDVVLRVSSWTTRGFRRYTSNADERMYACQTTRRHWQISRQAYELTAHRSAPRFRRTTPAVRFTTLLPTFSRKRVSLLLRQGDASRAFSVSDSSRTFNVERQRPHDAAPVRDSAQVDACCPQHTVLSSTQFCPDSVAIFDVSAKGVHVTRSR